MQGLTRMTATDQVTVRPAAAPPRPATRPVLWAALWTVAILAGTVAFGLWALTLADYPIGVLDAARAAVGEGHRADVLVIQQWRLPGVLAALLAGAPLFFWLLWGHHRGKVRT